MKKLLHLLVFTALIITALTAPATLILLRMMQKSPLATFDWVMCGIMGLSCIYGAICVMIEGQRP